MVTSYYIYVLCKNQYIFFSSRDHCNCIILPRYYLSIVLENMLKIDRKSVV